MTYPLRTKAKGREMMLEALLSVVGGLVSMAVRLVLSVSGALIDHVLFNLPLLLIA